MLKRIIGEYSAERAGADHNWLNLEEAAQVEVTSEEEAHPIESALLSEREPGWRAAQSGRQTVRLLFDPPRSIRLVRLLFQEDELQRTQEFVLRWSANHGESYRELVRQQFNFSPPGTTREHEEYTVNLEGVTALELQIVPDIGGGAAHASLEQLRIA